MWKSNENKSIAMRNKDRSCDTINNRILKKCTRSWMKILWGEMHQFFTFSVLFLISLACLRQTKQQRNNVLALRKCPMMRFCYFSNNRNPLSNAFQYVEVWFCWWNEKKEENKRKTYEKLIFLMFGVQRLLFFSTFVSMHSSIPEHGRRASNRIRCSQC